VYEFSTETLFFGRQDAMQRTTLLPVADYIRSKGLDPASMTIAEVGCGTGRFHTFIKVGWSAPLSVCWLSVVMCSGDGSRPAHGANTGPHTWQ
jgi:hypothetical protein